MRGITEETEGQLVGDVVAGEFDESIIVPMDVAARQMAEGQILEPINEEEY